MTKKPTSKRTPPTVSFKEEVAGRETLTAIAADRQQFLLGVQRVRTSTKHYGDRISNAPGALSPKSARAMDTAPEVFVSLQTPGRETYAIIHDEHRAEAPELEIITDQDELDDDDFLDALEIEQLHTFVVRAPIENFRSTEQRFRLVERRLLARMPGCTVDQISKIEIESTTTSEGTIVRIWTKIFE